MNNLPLTPLGVAFSSDLKAYQCSSYGIRAAATTTASESNITSHSVDQIEACRDNSTYFHTEFCSRVDIRADGLVVNKPSGAPLGCSNLVDNRHLNPILSQGLLEYGSPQQLLNLTHQLPGLTSSWDRVAIKQQLIDGYNLTRFRS